MVFRLLMESVEFRRSRSLLGGAGVRRSGGGRGGGGGAPTHCSVVITSSVPSSRNRNGTQQTFIRKEKLEIIFSVDFYIKVALVLYYL